MEKMDSSDIIQRACDKNETNIYENTKVASAESSKPQKTETEEGFYEKLRFEKKGNKRESFRCEDIPQRMKYFIYIALVLFIVIYVIVIALIIFVAVPKEQGGGWSNWETWSLCSDSCGGGIKSRTRSCSNPKPSTNGNQCMGNSEQVYLCNKHLCPGIDGGWSNWGTWSGCSDSCGGGLKSRNRSCSNPVPTTNGKQCIGSLDQVGQCNKELCPGIDGGWTLWENWGACAESCGGGVRTRSRSCTSPSPSLAGRPCSGVFTDVSICNNTVCPEHNVAFTAYNINRNSSSIRSILLFRNTYINNGNGYDTTTGTFKCNVPGVYHFAVTLLKFYEVTNAVSASIKINGNPKLALTVQPALDNNNRVGNYMLTGAGTLHLNRFDVVYVYGIPNHFHDIYYSYFTGFMITPDQ